MMAGADNKAHRQRGGGRGRRPPKQARFAGLKAGEKVIVRGQHGLPDGAAVTIGAMSLAGSSNATAAPSSWRSRCSPAAGVLAGARAAEQHLSPPRVSRASSSSGTAARCRRSR